MHLLEPLGWSQFRTRERKRERGHRRVDQGNEATVISDLNNGNFVEKNLKGKIYQLDVRGPA